MIEEPEEIYCPHCLELRSSYEMATFGEDEDWEEETLCIDCLLGYAYAYEDPRQETDGAGAGLALPDLPPLDA